MISQFSSTSQIEEIILEENKKFCEFFKFYKYNENKSIGKVS